MINVLMVCMGNICRSPMAEAVFRQLVAEAGLQDKISVDSAGTTGYHAGQPAHSGTLRILEHYGITDYAGRSRQITRGDLRTYDYIVVMDDDNLADVRSLAHGVDGSNAVTRLLDYAPHVDMREVPDPYYNNRFSEVYELVREGSKGLLAKIRKDHNL